MASKQISGGDVYVKKLVECTNSDTVELDIMLTGRARTMLNMDQANLRKITELDNKLSAGIVSLLWRYFTRIIKGAYYAATNSSKYDASIASSPFMYDILPAVLSRSQKKIVILFHILPERKAKNIVAHLRFLFARAEQAISLKIIQRYFDTILVGNDLLKQQLTERFPDKKIYVAHAGIDTKKIDSLVPNVVLKNANLGVFVGRLTQQKGILDIAACARWLQKTMPNFEIKIVGDGQDKDLFERVLQENNITNVTLLGYVSEEKKYRLLSQAKFFIFPSYEEGWGIALAEAMYCNCIAVTYELAHYRSLFRGYPFYVNIGEADMLGQTIESAKNRTPQAGQRTFIKQYDDTIAVQQVLKNLDL